MTQWIDFKLLKQQLSFEAVLDHYGVRAVQDGEAHIKACCPFHEDKRPSLGVDLKRKIWQCFACKTSGNVLDFVTRMEGYDPSDAGAIRKGAEAAIGIMSVDMDAHVAAKSTGVKRAKAPKAKPAQEEPTDPAPMEAPRDAGPENAPLSFELKLERSHKFLKRQGFKKSTYEAFSIGYCKRGMMKGRVCFPLRNAEAELIGYAGYWALDDLPKDTPRWLYPPKFNPARFIYNWHDDRDEKQTDVVITANLWDVLASHEQGVRALCIPELAVEPSHVTMLIEGGVTHVSLVTSSEPDDGNIEAALAALSPHVFIRVISLGDIARARLPDEVQ